MATQKRRRRRPAGAGSGCTTRTASRCSDLAPGHAISAQRSAVGCGGASSASWSRRWRRSSSASVMARLLTPSDFGVFAIAMAVTAFLMHVNDAGVIAAVVQWRGRIEDMATTAGVMALSFSVTVYGVVFAVAPHVADAASTPDATGVIRVLAAVILIDGITAVRSGTLMRRFRQDKLTLANLFGFVVKRRCRSCSRSAAQARSASRSPSWSAPRSPACSSFDVAERSPEVGFDRQVARQAPAFRHSAGGQPRYRGDPAQRRLRDRRPAARARGARLLSARVQRFELGAGHRHHGSRYVSVAGFSRLAEGRRARIVDSRRRAIGAAVDHAGAAVHDLDIDTCAADRRRAVRKQLGARGSSPALPDDPDGVPGHRFVRVRHSHLCGRHAFDAVAQPGLGDHPHSGAVLRNEPRRDSRHRDRSRRRGIVIAVPAAFFLLERVRCVRQVSPGLVRPAIAGILCAGVCIAGVLACRGSGLLQLVIAGVAGLATTSPRLSPAVRAAVVSRLRPPDRTSGTSSPSAERSAP